MKPRPMTRLSLRVRALLGVALIALLPCAAMSDESNPDDPFFWLEDVQIMRANAAGCT